MGSVARAVVSPLSIIDKDLGRLGLQAVALVAPFIPGGQIVAAAAAISLATLYKKKPGTSGVDNGGMRSRVNVDPEGPDVLLIGQTAGVSRLILHDTEGATNNIASMIYEHASGPIDAFDALYLNNELTSIDGSGNVTSGPYAGALVIETADGTQTTNPFADVAGSKWGSDHKGRGRALSHFKWTYDAEKLASGLPQTIQWVIDSSAVYDPRRDSTRGGSGSHRANDQTTWAYSVSGDDIARNPVLVELTYRLGWKKNGRLWAGMGENPDNIDYAAYIAMANVCDETVNGKPRYRIDGALSLGDDHNTNLSKIHATCAGRPIDQGGLIAIWVAHDDTADVVLSLTDDDFKSDLQWEPLPDNSRRNTARGSYISPADFYQPQPYAEVAPTGLLAIDNDLEQVDDLSFAMVQDVDQARRLACIRLHESRQGILQCVIDLRGIQLRPLDVIEIDHPRWGWTGKTFRVESWALTPNWTVALTLSAIASSDYDDIANVSLSSAAALDTVGYIPVLGDLATLDEVDFDTQVVGAGKTALIALATTAASDASDAIDRLDDAAADGVLTVSEKKTVLIPADAELENAWGELDALADDLDITTERTVAATARTAWQTYRDGLSPAWNSTTLDTSVTRSTLRGKLDDYDYALQALAAAISTEAAKRAVIGDGLVDSNGDGVDDRHVLLRYAQLDNLFHDPELIDAPSGRGWSAYNPGLAVGFDDAEGRYVRFSPGESYITAALKPARGGDVIDVDVEVYTAAAASTSVLGIFVRWYDGDGIQISGDFADESGAGDTAYTLGTSGGATVWRQLRGRRTLPASAAVAFVSVEIYANVTSGGLMYARKPRAWRNHLTSYSQRLDARLSRSTAVTTALLLGVRNTVSAQVEAADQGGSTGVTITVPSHVRKVDGGGSVVSISYNSGTLTGRAYSTTYYIYCSDPNLLGGAVTYTATINPDDMIGNFYHVSTIPTPADGAADTGGNGGSGSNAPYTPAPGGGNAIP